MLGRAEEGEQGRSLHACCVVLRRAKKADYWTHVACGKGLDADVGQPEHQIGSRDFVGCFGRFGIEGGN
jgi:hypothetical protein